ncbi:MAG: hypothetical protein AAF226_09780 [Verrucomicrobiota bacterium]
MKRSFCPQILFIVISVFTFTGCVTKQSSVSSQSLVSNVPAPQLEPQPTKLELATETAKWLKDCPNITWLPKQVSGRVDGATALDNIRQAAAGNAVKMSYYGNAPGGYVRLDLRMLRAMKKLVEEGYSFRVTSLAGASHSWNSLHYQGLAFDVDKINGVKVAYGKPYYWQFMMRCRELGATETFGPGTKGHSSHVHIAWPKIDPLEIVIP